MSNTPTLKEILVSAYYRGHDKKGYSDTELAKDVQALDHYVQEECRKAVIMELEKLHRYDGKDYDTELDELIDDRIAELSSNKRGL